MELRLIYDQGFKLSLNAVQSCFRWISSPLVWMLPSYSSVTVMLDRIPLISTFVEK